MNGDDQPPRNEFSPRYKGGAWAARIEAQDKVAAIVSVEAMAGLIDLVPQDVSSRGGRIAFEAREDFEIRWNGGRQYVAVKDRQVDRVDLVAAIRSLDTFTAEVTDEQQSLRVEAASLTGSARSLYEDVERVRHVRSVGTAGDREAVASDFQAQHQVPVDVATLVVVAERRIGQSTRNVEALFAHAVRHAVKIHGFSDDELITLLAEISTGVLRERRQARSVMTLDELERMLVSPLVPMQIEQFRVEYLRTRFGYIKDRSRARAIETERKLVRKFATSLLREWRRKTFIDRLGDVLYRGPIRCLECGHSLLANLNGRNGITCSRCGYQPFQTIFYACDCGNGAVVIRQPDLIAFELVRDAIRALGSERPKCIGCGQPPANERFLGRLFGLPIPYPVDRYPTTTLIKWRESLGWGGASWYGASGRNDLSPRQALEATRGEEPEPYT